MERRTFNRVIFSTQAELASVHKSWPTEIIDLSLKGALLATPTGLTVDANTTYSLQFRLEGLDQPIRMQGKVRHANPQLLGFQCELIDIDSATELRRLIELNLSDEILLHRDLAALLPN